MKRDDQQQMEAMLSNDVCWNHAHDVKTLKPHEAPPRYVDPLNGDVLTPPEHEFKFEMPRDSDYFAVVNAVMERRDVYIQQERKLSLLMKEGQYGVLYVTTRGIKTISGSNNELIVSEKISALWSPRLLTWSQT